MKIIKTFLVAMSIFICGICIHELGHILGTVISDTEFLGFHLANLPWVVGVKVKYNSIFGALATSIGGVALSSCFTIPLFIIGKKKKLFSILIPTGGLIVGDIISFGFADGYPTRYLLKINDILFVSIFIGIGIVFFSYYIWMLVKLAREYVDNKINNNTWQPYH
jgi:hypothetical protein